MHIYMYIDINECDGDDHGCQHRCVNNDGGFECECFSDGYLLDDDGKTCNGKLTIILIS